MEAQAAVGAPARCDAVLPLGRSESPTLVVEAVRHAVVSSKPGSCDTPGRSHSSPMT